VKVKFKKGDLVRVKTGIEDDDMPAHRTAVIIESQNGEARTKFYKVMFVGSDLILKFHEMFLESVVGEDLS
tara:strand:- start:114 stop:326 length:213 start_codon:yes stop_codon:yes gene_type:complete